MKISAKIAYTIITFFIFQQLLNAAEVNIYSARKEALIKPLLEKFSEKTKIILRITKIIIDFLLSPLTKLVNFSIYK